MRRRRSSWSRLLLAGAGLVSAFAASALLPVGATAALSTDRLPADGHTAARLVWSRDSLYGRPVPFWPWPVQARVVSGGERLRLVGSARRDAGPARLELGLVAAGAPGPAVIELDTGLERRRFALQVVPAAGDSDGDGLPDAAELWPAGDRRAFRRWFTAIAEAQFYAPDPRWHAVHRDCAGLIRFAYKEALRRHDRAWLDATPYLHALPGADVQRYHYPRVPVLGTHLFRTRAGPWRADAPAGQFAATASARVLWQHNTVFVSRSERDAAAGDLLFFRDPARHPSPMHSMVLLDPPGGGLQRRVVYHTGGGAAEGEVRLVQLAALNAHRDDRWHVTPANPRFLGFYRWKILEGGRP